MSDIPKVLVADDETACIELVRESLAQTQCQVLAAGDGNQALRMAKEHKPSVIILDVQMPKPDGFEVFYQLRNDANLAGIPVIMLTSVNARTGLNFSAKDMKEYFDSEPEAFLDKPIEPIVLKLTVERLLGAKADPA
jgi:CheY-like chemotaxis protein